jgi:ribosomal-protein-alanine N-acetyltransferase
VRVPEPGIAGGADRAVSLCAVGHRVRVAPVSAEDIAPYAKAIASSRERLRVWNPVSASDLGWHLSRQSPDHRTFMIHALDPGACAEPGSEPEHALVGKVNVTNVVRGRAQSATIGYDAYDPYAGRGLFAEGLRLVVGLAFARMPHGMGLHRVEASVQPGNTRSTVLLRSLGFRRRGAWPAYLLLPDASGVERWRDHVTYGLTLPEWPAEPFTLPIRRVPPVAVVRAAGSSIGRAAARIAVATSSSARSSAGTAAGARPASTLSTRSPKPRARARSAGSAATSGAGTGPDKGSPSSRS